METETTNPVAKEILLIGNANKAFSDVSRLSEHSCQICSNMLDGIEASTKCAFKTIGVVVTGFPAKLGLALKALRQTNSKARIILLVQMHKEPTAINLINSANNGQTVADDYLIFPTDVNSFYRFVEKDEKESQVGLSYGIDQKTKKKIEQLERLATTDELTELKNRRYIWEFTRQIIEHAKKQKGQVTLLIFDIDNFKHYNDIYGHSAGDEILKQAAVLMQRCCREHDVVGRIGGDEFVVIFWDPPSRKSGEGEKERRFAKAEHPQEVLFIANRFLKELNRAELPMLGTEGKGVLTISGGLAGFPRDGETMEQLFQKADEALLDAKRGGKNRIYLVGHEDGDIKSVE